MSGYRPVWETGAYRAVIRREAPSYTIRIEREVMWDNKSDWWWEAGPARRWSRRSAERWARKKLRQCMRPKTERKPIVIDSEQLRAEEWAKTVERSGGRLLPSSTVPERVVAPPPPRQDD